VLSVHASEVFNSVLHREVELDDPAFHMASALSLKVFDLSLAILQFAEGARNKHYVESAVCKILCCPKADTISGSRDHSPRIGSVQLGRDLRPCKGPMHEASSSDDKPRQLHHSSDPDGPVRPPPSDVK
jgi:hypothetical protein